MALITFCASELLASTPAPASTRTMSRTLGGTIPIDYRGRNRKPGGTAFSAMLFAFRRRICVGQAILSPASGVGGREEGKAAAEEGRSGRRGGSVQSGMDRSRPITDTSFSMHGGTLHAGQREVEPDGGQILKRRHRIADYGFRHQRIGYAKNRIGIDVIVAPQIQSRHQFAIARRADHEMNVGRAGSHAVAARESCRRRAPSMRNHVTGAGAALRK